MRITSFEVFGTDHDPHRSILPLQTKGFRLNTVQQFTEPSLHLECGVGALVNTPKKEHKPQLYIELN